MKSAVEILPYFTSCYPFIFRLLGVQRAYRRHDYQRRRDVPPQTRRQGPPPQDGVQTGPPNRLERYVGLRHFERFSAPQVCGRILVQVSRFFIVGSTCQT